MTAGMLVIAAPILSSCSYGYGILAVARQGRITFIVDPQSRHQPDCVRRIELLADEPLPAEPPSNDQSVANDVVWQDSVDYDDACANRFPLSYGQPFKGRHQPNDSRIGPSSLKFDTVYEILATTGATGYGGGRFIVHRDGRIENLARR